ncbi:MAG: glycosyltransferase [Candidatus Omnitrophica bacterium]|nr:glycosyltransferase [Candidatus Omnitrophota bacterium]
MELLYISYDGMLEPLGQSQVLSYLRQIAKHRTVALLSYEKRRDLKDRGRLVPLAQELQAAAIHWRRLRYHKWPSLLATGYDALRGIVAGIVLCRRHRIRVVHARGYVASVIAVRLKRCCGTRFIFDMRGFWADEKVDAGHWSSHSLAYRLAKRWERRFFEEADAIVSLTAEGIAAFPTLGYRIPSDRPTVVVPTCVDLDRFVPGQKDPELLTRFGLHDATVIGCVGNTGNWYLRDWMLRYLAFVCGHLPNVKVLLVTRDDHARLKKDAVAAGVPPDRLVLTQASFEEMPAYLRLLDLAVFFRKLQFSKQGSLAAKLGELLASGVPMVINEGIGDAGALIRQERVGVVLSDVSDAAFETTFDDVARLLQDPLCRRRCRQVAERHFDLHMGVGRYLELYRCLNGSDEPKEGEG